MPYPDFISDREGLDRWRTISREGDGHAVVANKNTVFRFVQTVDRLEAELKAAQALLNAPELHDFASGVTLEAAHQRQRWGADHDAGKAPEDWFWLLGFLGGKALHAAKAGDRDKALHHTISTAAALANWHAALLGVSTSMRPGIDPAARGLADEAPGEGTAQ